MGIKTFFVLLCALGFVSGCSKPYRTPLVDPEGASFVGLETLQSVSSANTVTIIMIHGMCHHTKQWFVDSQERIGEQFQYQTGPVRTVLDGGPTGVSAYRADLNRDDRRIALYGIVYSPVTFPVKQQSLCKDASKETELCPSEPTYSHPRGVLNAPIKNVLLNDCLADAIVYQGPTGERVRQGARAALVAIHDDRAADAKLEQSPVILLSESLGSKVLRDSLLCKPDERIKRILPTLSYTAQVFLGANQIPLLNLGAQASGCGLRAEAEVQSRVFGISRELKGNFSDVMPLIRKSKSLRLKGPVPEPAKIVAFTDPNDLLSYEVDPAEYGGVEVINIAVSNAPTWLGLFENPYQAHVGYRENPRVLDLIRCGYNVEGADACRK